MAGAPKPTFHIRLLRTRTMPDRHIYTSGSVVPATIDSENTVRILHHSKGQLAIFHVEVTEEDWELVMEDTPAFFM